MSATESPASRAPSGAAAPASSSVRPHERLGPAVLALTAVGALLRFATLDTQSFWLDEATTARLVGLDFADMLAAVSSEEVTPPLYYLVVWGWAAVFGAGEVGLRSLSALLGTALVPIAFLVAREVAGRRAAVLCAALVTVSPILVWYSQEARSYALLALLGGASLLFFVRAARSSEGGALAAWAVVSALALATHYFAIFLVAAEAAWLLLASPRRGRALLAIGAVGLAGVALLPTALAQQAGPGVGWISTHPLLGRVLLVFKKFLAGETGHDLPGAQWVVAALVLVALVLLVVRAGAAEQRAGAGAAALVALLVLPPLALALVGLDYLVARNLVVAWLPAALLVSLGPASPRAGRAGVVVGGALVATLAAVTVATSFVPAVTREDWRGLARELDIPPGGRVIAVMPPHEARSLRHYVPLVPAPPGGRYAEIVVVQTNRAGPQPTPAAPPGFRLVGRRERQRLTVISYEATDPRRAAYTLPGVRAAPLIQAP